jgi:hypothetical protein
MDFLELVKAVGIVFGALGVLAALTKILLEFIEWANDRKINADTKIVDQIEVVANRLTAETTRQAALIDRQHAEIDRLTAINDELKGLNTELTRLVEKLMAEMNEVKEKVKDAVKEEGDNVG